MAEQKRILVTGGSGLVGQGIKAAWQKDPVEGEEFYWASSKDCDLKDRESTKALFEKFKPTHVFHLAAKVGGLYGNMKANLEFFRINMKINDNVLSLASRKWFLVCPLVFSLTRPLILLMKLWFKM